MDITETYIKMSDHPKIQEQWKPDYKLGSVLFLTHTKEIMVDKTNNLSGAIWLPRQDQIQYMMGKTESAFCIYQAENKWGGEVYQDREQVLSIELNSPEQLWLTFYMHEKHKLKWKDGKWQ